MVIGTFVIMNYWSKLKETTKNKIIPLVVQFDAGGGPVKSGTSYEKEMENM